MKATQKDFARGLPQGLAGVSIFFFCGPDEAGASAAAERVIAALPGAGERIELTAAELKRDPARLGDEARSGSLFGDQRHIFVRSAGEETHDALKVLIETADAGAGEAAPVIVVATSATDKSRTAKLLEKRKDALVAMFHPPDLASVTSAVRAMADAAGLRLGGDLAERIARAAGLDVRLAQSEITKLALYCDASAHAPCAATLEDHAAIGAACEDDGFATLVDAVLTGDLPSLPGELRRMRELGFNPVGLALALERRANQLAQIAGRLGARGNFDRLSPGEKAQLGIFWRDEGAVRVQFGRWIKLRQPGARETRLERLLPRLVALHRKLLANSQTADLLLANELAEIARFAAKP